MARPTRARTVQEEALEFNNLGFNVVVFNALASTFVSSVGTGIPLCNTVLAAIIGSFGNYKLIPDSDNLELTRETLNDPLIYCNFGR